MQLRLPRMAARITGVALAMVALVAGAPAASWSQGDSTAAADERVEEVLELDGEPRDGRHVFAQTASPSCASCHVLGRVGARGRLGPNLDEMQPREETVVRAVVGGAVEIHERQGLSRQLSNEQVADLAAFVSRSTTSPVARIDVGRALGESPWVGIALALSALVMLASCWYMARILLELLRRADEDA